MTISQIYQQYQILDILSLHQLRVASVGKMICDYYPDVNQANIIVACLLHDMGNILKINFDSPLSKKTLTAQERLAGKKNKDLFQQKYGDNEKSATLKIIEELSVSQQIKDIVAGMCFTSIVNDDFLKAPIEQQICEYADMRVDPYGIVELSDRLDDIEKRYKDRYPSKQHQQNRVNFAQVMKKVETQLFNHIPIEPSDINNQALNDTIKNLKQFKIN